MASPTTSGPVRREGSRLQCGEQCVVRVPICSGPLEVFPVVVAPLLTGPCAVDARALDALNPVVGSVVKSCEQDRPDPTQELAERSGLNDLDGLIAGEFRVVEVPALRGGT